MRVVFFVVMMLVIQFTARAQKTYGSVKGTIADTSGKQDLSEATVSLTPLSDSSDIQYVTTDKNGSFRIKNLLPGNYSLLISFEGYQHIRKSIAINGSDHRDLDLGFLYMQHITDQLQEVVIQVPPVLIRKDTVEYNAGSFTTKPNAVAEDLLKKMPGIQVDKNGTITAQGETVNRVLVNGKRFFSDDPKLATRNLPPEIIDKIQVFDDLSDQSKFSGFDDGNRVKTINIITKKDKRQGYFGKVVAGAGTNENYDESINMHRFENDEQISLIGQANDINKQNFTADGNQGGRGGGAQGAASASSNNPGVTTIWAGGANYKNSFGPTTDLYGSYFFNSQHISVNQQDSTIKSIQSATGQDSTNTTTGFNSNIQRRVTHRVYLNLEQRFDSSNSLIFRPNIVFQNNDPNTTYQSNTSDNHGLPVNQSVGYSSSHNSGFNINGSNLQLRHKFAKKFRTISLDLAGTANMNEGYGYNYAVNDFYRPRSTDTLNQYIVDTLHSYTVNPTLSYTEPVGKNQILELNLNYNYQHNVSVNNTFDTSDSLENSKTFDSLFSNSYRFISHASRITLNYRIQNPKFNLSVGSGLQFTGFNSLNTTKNILVAQNYTNLTPTVNFQYTFSKTKHLRFNYNGRPGTPTVTQLQPLITTTDQINYQEGNPALKPQFTHSLRMLYSSFDPGTQHVLFATINASAVANDIQQAVYYNSKGGQQTTYVNLNGTYNFSGYFNYGFPLKKPKSNLNFITNLTYAQSQTLLAEDSASAAGNNYAHVFARNSAVSETVSWTTNIKKNFDMNLSSVSKYNINNRTGEPVNKLDQQSNLNVFSQSFSLELTAYTNSGWLFAANLDYTYTNNHSAAYNASVPLLSPAIAKQLFKKKNGELRLSVFDLLNQNVSVSKTVTSSLETYARTNVITRYAMLTFTYNLNNFSEAKQNQMPGMFPGRNRREFNR
jgi:hypothetical protein